MPGAHSRVALARARVARYLTDTCRIDRVVGRTDDGAGGWTDVTEPVTVPCAVAPRDVQPSEEPAGAALGADMRWRITLPAGTEVAPEDRIVQVSVSPNRLFEVLGVDGPRTLEVKRAAICVERL